MKKEEKINTYANGQAVNEIHRAMLDAKKVSLRIDHRTVIIVSKENCTKEYAEAYKKRLEESEKNSRFNFTGGHNV